MSKEMNEVWWYIDEDPLVGDVFCRDFDGLDFVASLPSLMEVKSVNYTADTGNPLKPTKRVVKVNPGILLPQVIYCRDGVPTKVLWASENHFLLGREMMKVQGLGARGVLKILAKNKCDDILTDIRTGDRKGFVKRPGIGPKTGAKLVDVLFKASPQQPAEEKKETSTKAMDDAVSALRSLGYPASRAKEAVKWAAGHLPSQATTEDLIRIGLNQGK
jgi:hypothetical protein